MARWPRLAVLAVVLCAPVAQAKPGDIYFQTSHFANGDYDSVKVLRFDPATRTLSTVVDSASLPTASIFARADGTLLLADPNKAAAVSPAGDVRRLHPRVPRAYQFPAAAGFLPSGDAAYGLSGAGLFRSGHSLAGRLHLMPGSRRAERPTGHIAGITRELVASDGSIISQVQTASPGARFVLIRFQRFDPRARRTRIVVSQRTIMHNAQGNVWGILPGGGIVVATGRPQRTVFWIAKPRAGRWPVHRFAPPWRRPIDDGAIAVTGLPGGDLAIVRTTTADNGGFVLDEGLQILRLTRGGQPTVLYDLPPRADPESFLGGVAVQP